MLYNKTKTIPILASPTFLYLHAVLVSSSDPLIAILLSKSFIDINKRHNTNLKQRKLEMMKDKDVTSLGKQDFCDCG